MALKILLLASGSGTLAQAVIDRAMPNPEIDAKRENASYQILGLVSDKECGAIERAQQANLPTKVISLRGDRAVWNQEFFQGVADFSPELVVSVGFMKILSPEFVNHFPTINTHPALLPNFPGAHAVADALAAKAQITGSTVHWVDAGVDTGKVIAQEAVEILPSDDEENLHERIKKVERRLIVETIEKLASDRSWIK